jgi:DNA-binding transcriptional ArsR family regulator
MKTTTVDLDRLRAAAGDATAMLRTLGNEDRLLLLCELALGELNVTELSERTGIVQPTLSQQLAVLRSQELVATRREGKQIYYSVADRRVLELLKALHRLFCEDKHRAN